MSCEISLQNPPPAAPQIDKFLLVAAAALIDADGRVLINQRPAGKWMEGKWEFPGGKVESGEVPEFALMRELREELGIETRPTCFTPVTFASHVYEETNTHVLMPLYGLRMWDGTPESKESQALKWVRPQEMFGIDFVEADLPILPILEEYLR